MDTRQKIVSPSQAGMFVGDGNWLVVAGFFDPLTPSLVERLNDLVAQGRDEKVLAIVLDGPDTLLSAEARSILIAALRVVDIVTVMLGRDLTKFASQEARIRFVFDAEAERTNSAEFAELVIRKQALILQDRELVS